MKRLVVIDDEAIVIRGIRVILERLKMDIELAGFAHNGLDGINVIREVKPDIVMTDIRMPGLDGLSMIESIQEEMPKVYFVIISGYTDFAYTRSAIQLGVVDYIDKPLTIEKVRAVFENILRSDSRKSPEAEKKVSDSRVIQALTKADPESFLESCREYMDELSSYLNDFNEFKEKTYRFLCVIREIFSEQAEDYHDTPISYSQMTALEDRRQVKEQVMKEAQGMVAYIKAEQQGSRNKTIQQILKYIEENYSKDIGLTELAEQVGLNPTYLCILFKKEVGTSYVRYLTEFRIRKAKKLLRDGHKVSEVSEMVGYNSYRYFSDIFKRYVGLSPNEYRSNGKK